MSLNKCMRGTTQRQYAVWMVHLDTQIERPSTLEWYIMNLTREVRAIFSKAGQLADYILRREKPLPKTPEARLEKSRSAWLAIAGDKITYRTTSVKPHD